MAFPEQLCNALLESPDQGPYAEPSFAQSVQYSLYLLFTESLMTFRRIWNPHGFVGNLLERRSEAIDRNTQDFRSGLETRADNMAHPEAAREGPLPRNQVAVERIPLFKPKIAEEAIEAVGNVLRSGWIGLGPRTLEFERAFAHYVDAPHCIALNSGTAALHIALKLLGVGPGDEVISTALTFVSTNHSILYEGAEPVFADVQAHTGNLDPASIKDRLSDRTKAIILVHFAGYPCDLDEIYALAKEHNINVIEDCAHATGAEYRGKKIGEGELCTFSFHAVKNLPTGDGGALTTSSEAFDARSRKLRWLGIDKSTYQRASASNYSWDYLVEEVGYKYHMNDIAAAIALVQLEKLDEENARRQAIAARYTDQLAGTPGLRLLEYEKDRTSVFWFFPILAENRDELMAKLGEAKVDTGVHFRRNDAYPMYREQDLPATERFWRHELSLPMHLSLTDEQVDYVCEVIRSGW